VADVGSEVGCAAGAFVKYCPVGSGEVATAGMIGQPQAWVLAGDERGLYGQYPPFLPLPDQIG
jgi:hypothetical protein